MFRTVYCIEVIDENYDIAVRRYARNMQTARQIAKYFEKHDYEVVIRDATRDFKDGEPINPAWIEG